ncbi:WD40 repeat-like protein [Lactarius sanguifluus]|nr:WD40 repeat-like protein [Lactarius sanguifluus]
MSFTRVALYAANPSTTRGESTKLSASKDKIRIHQRKDRIYTRYRRRVTKNPALGVSYSGHVQNTTVARISPTGYYCASADTLGTVRIWDIVGEDQTLKGEYKVLSGKINDLEWDGESKRIIAVGDGKEKWVVSVGSAVQKWLTGLGSSTGEILGHSKVVNAVAIRRQRPFRAATAGDDNLIVFHQGDAITAYNTYVGTTSHAAFSIQLSQGSPFGMIRYAPPPPAPSTPSPPRSVRAHPRNLSPFLPGPQTIKTHTKFVQDVRYAPSGDHFASVGSDGKVFLYDWQSTRPLRSSVHKAISTCSADATVKLWDIETRKATTTYTLGTGLEHQQVGNVWSSQDTIVSLSFSGCLNVFDRRSGEKRPVKVLHGPQKAVTAATISTTASETFFVGSADGRVLSYDSTGTASPLAGQGHTNLVSALASAPDGRVFSTGYDDRVREVEGSQFTYIQFPSHSDDGWTETGTQIRASVFSTASQPKTLAAAKDGTIFVLGVDAVEAVRNHQKVADLRPWGGGATIPTAIAATGSLVAIGFGDQKVRLYDWDGKTLQEAGLLHANGGLVSVLAFSPDGSKLAAGDSSGKVILYDVAKREMITPRWSFHTARVNTLSWTADSLHCASGALDTHIYVWSVRKPSKKITITNAVPGGVNAVLWVSDDGRLAGMGADAAVKVWQVAFHDP